MKEYLCVLRITCTDRHAASAVAVCLNCDVGDYQVTYTEANPENGLAIKLVSVEDGLVLALCGQQSNRRLVITGLVPEPAIPNMSEFISNLRGATLETISFQEAPSAFTSRAMTHRPVTAISHGAVLSISALAKDKQ